MSICFTNADQEHEMEMIHLRLLDELQKRNPDLTEFEIDNLFLKQFDAWVTHLERGGFSE